MMHRFVCFPLQRIILALSERLDCIQAEQRGRPFVRNNPPTLVEDVKQPIRQAYRCGIGRECTPVELLVEM